MRDAKFTVFFSVTRILEIINSKLYSEFCIYILDCLVYGYVSEIFLAALNARDLDKFLSSIGKQPAYVDLEVIFYLLLG